MLYFRAGWGTLTLKYFPERSSLGYYIFSTQALVHCGARSDVQDQSIQGVLILPYPQENAGPAEQHLAH